MNAISRSFDAAPPTRLNLKREFAKAKLAEAGFATRLKQVAAHIVALVRGFDPTNPVELAYLQQSLRDYGAAIRPWAGAVALRMVGEVAARDKLAWRRVSERMGLNLQRQLTEAPLAPVMAQLAEVQTQLITSLPSDAGAQVAEWTQAALSTGERPKAIADRIMSQIGGTTRARAITIARTESSRAASVITASRAQWVGCTHYTWMSAGDSDVRKLHRRLNGQVFRYDSPPVADERSGIRAGPGQIWNCRCVGLPVLEGLNDQ